MHAHILQINNWLDEYTHTFGASIYYLACTCEKHFVKQYVSDCP